MASSIIIEQVRKTKKNEPKIFPAILTIDREAFGKIDEQAFVLKTFWRSQSNKIIVARKSDTKAIVGYACFQEMDGGCYLMRIAVRTKSQRGGIGRRLMNYMFQAYPNYLSLDVSTDNEKAVSFYSRIGLEISKTYLSQEKVEFASFQTPADFVAPLMLFPNESTVKVNESVENSNSLFQTNEPQLLEQNMFQKQASFKDSDSDIETQSSRSAFSEKKA
jgi:ribosomal protein S18 acetylase RimI-like enzyme